MEAIQTIGNAELIEAGLVSAPLVLAPAEEVRRGKGIVHVQRFAGNGSASAVKAALKAADPKLSAKALTLKTNEVLRGERDVRSQFAVAWVQGRLAAGDIPSHGEITSGGSCLRMKSLPAVVVAPAVIPQGKDEIKAELAKLQARLAKMEAEEQVSREQAKADLEAELADNA